VTALIAEATFAAGAAVAVVTGTPPLFLACVLLSLAVWFSRGRVPTDST